MSPAKKPPSGVLALDTKGGAKEGSYEDYVATDGEGRNAKDGKDRKQYS